MLIFHNDWILLKWEKNFSNEMSASSVYGQRVRDLADPSVPLNPSPVSLSLSLSLFFYLSSKLDHPPKCDKGADVVSTLRNTGCCGRTQTETRQVIGESFGI